MTQKVTFGAKTLSLLAGETVLDGLERHGISRASSCRSGVCQSCLMKVVRGDVPTASQQGMKEAWKTLGYFLPCVCVPEQDLVIASVDDLETYAGRIARVETISVDHAEQQVLRVLIEVGKEFRFRAGQFLSLVRPEDGLTRPYSIASLPEDREVELHVAVLPEGHMSQWLLRAEGERVEIRGPSGECFYQPASPHEPMLLAGTGTGLAPLLGVAREALAADHKGPVYLYHGAPRASGLYYWSELRELTAAHGQLQLVGSVLDNDAGFRGVRTRALEDAIISDLPDLKGFRVYLCGNPQLVRSLKKKCFLLGADLQRIHSDPFITASG